MTKYIVRVEKKRTQTYFLEYEVESKSKPNFEDVDEITESLPINEELADEEETNEIYDIEEVSEDEGE